MKKLICLLTVAMLALSTLQAHAVNTPRTPTIDKTKNYVIITWAGLDGDDVGVPVSKETCHVPINLQMGTQGGNTHGSGTYILQGSNDLTADPSDAGYASSVWVTLTTNGVTTISRTTAALAVEVWEAPMWVRPSSSGGTAGDMDVVLICERR